ncbi:hypothetical protein V9L20_25205 [Variovorax sp. CCNWLW225]|uniref:hypothetical protein n=1 Tax=Variovorax TaxID=34072 RepID=UPI0013DE9A9D|nr:hypothetical protein [Variovorax beijingensis]
MAIDLGWSEVAISLDDQLEFAAVDGHDAQGERLRASNCGTSDVTYRVVSGDEVVKARR